MAFDKRRALQNALFYTQQGRLDKAIAEYQAILKADPNDLAVYNSLGDLYARIGARDEAIAQFQKLGDHFRADGLVLKAIAVYKKIIKLDPTYIPAYLACADLYSQQGLKGEARLNLEEAANYYLKEGNVPKALEVYKKLAALDPSNLAISMKLADMLLKEGMKREALTQLHLAGEGYLRNGQLSEAQRCFRRMLQIQPDSPEARSGMGQTHYHAGSFLEAAEELGQIRDLKDPVLLEMLADSYKRMGQKDKSVEVFRRILAIDPDHEGARQALGLLYLEVGDSESAYRELHPLAEIYMREGQIERAIEVISEIVRRDIHHQGSLEMLAELFHKAGDKARAVEEYNRVAEIYEEQGKMEEAAEIYQRLLDIEPEREDFTRRFREIKEKREIRPEEVEVPVAHLEEGEQLKEEAEAFDIEEISAEVFSKEVGTEEVSLEVEVPDEPLVSEYIKKAEVYLKYGLLEQAVEQLQQALKFSPDNLNAHGHLKRVFLEKGLIREAIQESLSLAKIYEERGLGAQAVYELQKALDLDPDNEEARNRFKEFMEASPVLEEASLLHLEETIEPQESLEEAAYTGVGLIQEEELPAELEEVLELPEEESVEIIPGIYEPYSSLTEDLAEAEFYLQQGMHGEARSVLERVLSLDPDNAHAMERMAQLEEIMKGPSEEVGLPPTKEETITVFKVAQEDPELREEGYVDLARELERELMEEDKLKVQGGKKGVEPTLEEVPLNEFQRGVREKLDREDYETHYNLGIAYKEMDLLDEAIEEFRLAARDEPRALSCANLLGLCYLAKGMTGEAIQEFHRGLTLKGYPPEEYLGLKYELASAYEIAGDTAKAFELFSEIQAGNPTFRNVKEKVRELQDRMGPSLGEPPQGAPESTPKPPKPLKRKISFI